MKIDVVSLSQRQIDDALAKAKVALPAETFHVFEKVVEAYSTVLSALENKDTTIGRLRRMLFGSSIRACVGQFLSRSFMVLLRKSIP